MSKRQQQKAESRQALLNAARHLLQQGRSFGSLSLREITREAGFAAPAFYRHFQNVDNLGEALVDETGQMLRNLLREGRGRVASRGRVIDTSIEILLEFMLRHPAEMRLLIHDGYGASSQFRLAVQRERRFFAEELGSDINRLAEHRGREFAHVAWLAEAIIAVVFTAAIQMLDEAPPQRQAIAQRLIGQIGFLMTGAEQLAAAGQTKFRPANPG